MNGKCLLLLLAVSVLSQAAFAGDGYGVITRITARADVAYIKIDPPPPVLAACAVNSWHYAFPIVDATGKAALSMALAA